MSFDQFALGAGFDVYYGRDEYGNDDDFDGNWGIFDEPFLQYTAKELTAANEPFFGLAFTLSSHHPFTMPAQHKGRFPKGSHPILETVAYSDYALQQFFEAASKMPWYENTLFIITADHTGPPTDKDASNYVNAHSIPLLFFHPDGRFGGASDEVVSQTDLMPSILDWVGCEQSYRVFGNSIFDTITERFAYTFLSATYQLINEEYTLHFNGNTTKGLYRYKTDPLLEQNLLVKMGVPVSETADNSAESLQLRQREALRLENKIKAILQTHHHVMINNLLFPE